MGKTYDFLKECGTFFVASVDCKKPQMRPFGAIMEYEKSLYISTSNDKPVYSQLINNPNIQIAAIKCGTREWVRVTGKVCEEKNKAMKEKMLNVNPVLQKRFSGINDEKYVLFKIYDMDSVIYTENSIMKID